MDDKLDKIILDIGDLNNKIECTTPKTKKIFNIIEKLLIPIMLGVLAYIANMASIEISKAQNVLAEQEAVTRAEQFDAQLQVKYLELFYADITSGDVDKQKNAITLLSSMNEKLASSLGGLIESAENIDATLKTKAVKIIDEIQSVSILEKYKIGIYPAPNSVSSDEVMSQIVAVLRNAGISNIQTYKKDTEFFNKVTWPKTVEIRYEKNYEEEQADLLKKIFENSEVTSLVKLKMVNNRTNRFISIFIPK